MFIPIAIDMALIMLLIIIVSGVSYIIFLSAAIADVILFPASSSITALDITLNPSS